MLTVCISSRSLKSQMLPQLGVILPNGFQQWPEMEDGRGACVCRKINVMVSKPKATSSYQTPDTRSQTHNANLEYQTETKGHEQNEIKAFVSYLQRYQNKKKASEWSRYNSHGFVHEGEKEGVSVRAGGGEEQIPFFLKQIHHERKWDKIINRPSYSAPWDF